MYGVLLYGGFFAILVGIIWLTTNLIRKKKIVTPGIITGVGIIAMSIVFIAAAFEGRNSTAQSSSSEAASSSSSSQGLKINGLNKKATDWSGNVKQYSIEIQSADQNWNDFAAEQGKYDSDIFSGKQSQSLQITVKYYNYNLENDFLPNLDSFKVYNPDGSAANVLDYQDPQTEVSQGHSGTTSFWVTMNKPIDTSKKLTIEYSEDGTTSGRVTFKVPVQTQ